MREAPPKLAEPFFIHGTQKAKQELVDWWNRHRLLLAHAHPLVDALKREIKPILDGFEEVQKRGGAVQ